MGLVTNAIRNHAGKDLDDLRAERLELLRKASEVGREIAEVEAHEILGGEYAAAEGKTDGKVVRKPAATGAGEVKA